MTELGAPSSSVTKPTTTVKSKPGARKALVSEFRASYTKTHRAVEITSVTVFFAAQFAHYFRLASVVGSLESVVTVFVAIVTSMALADFISGIVHWGADTWGTVDFPIVGKHLIRSFREHHVDPSEICNHDFIETNGDSCMVTLPVLVPLLLAPLSGALLPTFAYTFVVSLTFWVMLTNQFHKWAHSLPEDVPVFIRPLQKFHIVLNNQMHYIHHRRPFDQHYCITTGWMNGPLAAIGFWKAMERAVTAVTGAVPRADDFYYAQKYLDLQDQKWN